jgi:FolB domain-containing protein
MPDSAMDRIHIRDLSLRCIVGINPEERTNKQDVIINVTMWADLRKACASDAIEDTIDYKSIKKSILAMVEGSSFFLVERLAEEVCALCLRDERVRRVTVSVDKPGALRFARSVAIEITRDQAG